MQWADIIGEQKEQAYFKSLLAFVEHERDQGLAIYPPSQDVFNAFKYTPLDRLKVVILGQDPYHGPNQAHGLSFSVKKGNSIPPSLRNIYQELTQDIEGFTSPLHGELISWAEQGVLLLNTVLTVRHAEAHSHKNKGWETFTDAVISAINHHQEGIIFMLWGAPAQKKAKLIDEHVHHILRAPHPSPLSAHRGFFGCKHFSQANALLQSMSKTSIDWRIHD